MKRVLKIFIILIFTISSITINNKNNINGIYDSYRGWKQQDSAWGSKILGTSGKDMSTVGCAVTALAILTVHSKARSESTFNPGVLVDYLSKNGGFDVSGNIYWGSVSGLVPELTYYQAVDLTGTDQKEKTAEIKKYLEQGFRLIISVKNKGHWVTIDRVENEKVYIFDPGYKGRELLFENYEESTVQSLRLYKCILNKEYKTGSYTLTSNTNLRSSAGKTYPVKAVIPLGTTLNVTDISGNWGKVVYGNVSGWTCLDYADYGGTTPDSGVPVPNPIPTTKDRLAHISTVSADGNLNHRTEPNSSSASNGLIPNGTYVIIMETSGNWGKCTFGGKFGWVNLDYVVFDSGYVKCDVSRDGIINVVDYVLLKAEIINDVNQDVPGLYLSDINGDYRVDIFDDIKMKKILMGAA
ncbi:MAG: SH3 domain-containing protein [Ruminococcus sp.]|nr:SH3 domain-containing protein [Ruminococcus sp.]